MCIKDGEKYINEQIESIINQDFKNWELIIIDDCSVDNSLQIAHKYRELDNRILVKRNPRKLGVINNFLINSSNQNGEWIVFCDQDDIWKFNKLSCLNFYIENNPEFNLFLHNGSYLVSDKKKIYLGAFGEVVINNKKVYEHIPNLRFINLLFRNQAIGCFICIKREFFQKFITLIPKANIYHDHWIVLISSIYSKIFFINQDLISYRRHEKTNTKTNKFLNKISDRFLIVFSLLLNHFNLIKGKDLKVLKEDFNK